jgi:hypothetical protein
VVLVTGVADITTTSVPLAMCSSTASVLMGIKQAFCPYQDANNNNNNNNHNNNNKAHEIRRAAVGKGRGRAARVQW